MCACGIYLYKVGTTDLLEFPIQISFLVKQLKTHNNICLSVFLLSHLQLSATPWTVAHQAPLSMSAGVQLQQPGIQPEEMNGVRNEAASQFSFGLPVYFKFKILFYTFTKTLGQRLTFSVPPLPDLLSP